MSGGYGHEYAFDRYGVANSSIYLNNGCYNLPDGVYFNGDFSFSVWVKMLRDSGTILDCGNEQYDDNVILRASDGNSKPNLLIYRLSSSSSSKSSTALDTNKWTNLVFTLNGTISKIYINSTLIATDLNMNIPRNLTRTNNYIGKSNWGGYSGLKGYLDDIRIYNRAFSESEVSQLFLNGTITLTNISATITTTSTKTTATSSSTTLENTSMSNISSDMLTSESSTSTTPKTSVIENLETASVAIVTQTVPLPSIVATLNTTFGFSQLTANQSVQLLSSNYDLSGCIVNCSNHGSCKFDAINNQFTCACDMYYSHKSCSTDLRQCSTNPCLNNSTCVDFSNTIDYNMTSIVSPNSTSTFYCLCNKYYQGTFCETKIDVCKNQTCSNHGNCVDKNNQPFCECFSLYLGENCNIESSGLIVIQSVISVSSIIALIVVISFYGCFIIIDLTKIFQRKNYRKKVHQFTIMKYVYIN
jgi:hypothetical protein